MSLEAINWSWNRGMAVVGDFTVDGRADLAALFDYDNDDTGLWVFRSENNLQPDMVWRSDWG